MLRLLFRIFIYTLLFVAFIIFGPSALFLDIQPQTITIPFPKSFTGPLEANNILSSAQKLFVKQIEGPESIAVYNGSIFTGSNDGYIYKIDGNYLKPVIKVIKNECPDVWNKTVCGHPLGLKFDSKGVLYVVEPSYGIYTVEDLLTNAPKVKQVFDIKLTKTLGKPSVFLDDIAIDENGGESGGTILYISDVSIKFDISNVVLVLFDYDLGRLIRYNTVTKKLDKVISGVSFPNGVELTDDKTAILFAEFGARRIFKHYIRGPKAGQTLVLLSELPGEPDNIRRSATIAETYWTAFIMARNESSIFFLDTLIKYSVLKKFIARISYIVGSAVEFIGSIFGNYALRELGYGIKTGELLLKAYVKNSYGMVIEFDVNGNILQSLHSPDGSVSALSEARELKISDTESVLYLGSFVNNYLGKLSLKNRK